MGASSLLLLSLLGFLAFSQSTPLSNDCPVGCPRIFDPICATDGANNIRYFYNKCLLQYDECISNRAWSVALMSLCVQQMDPIIREKCSVGCPSDIEPICATNELSFHRFENECILDVENCLSNGAWSRVSDNVCELEDVDGVAEISKIRK